MASSFSFSTSAWTYDVFLSFRGEDTCHGFTSQLYNALKQSGIYVFTDDIENMKGEEIAASLLQAIERSRIAIIIFSPDYASSRWCQDELVKIMECERTQAQVVIPIFYGVDPSDVRHQRGRFGEAMQRREQRMGRGSDRVLRWREALTAAANKAGFSSSAYRHESDLVEIIVKHVSERLDVGQLFVAAHPVGIESRVHELTSEWSQKMLDDGQYDVFLSFTCADTCPGFTSHLSKTLRQSGINVFMDDAGIGRGKHVSCSLEQTIERSRLALVILSPDYASSPWCLDELVKIMECHGTQAQVVIPIFYEVYLFDVRHQRGTFGEAMEEYERRLGRKSDRVLRWREALTAAADMAGFSSSAYRHESQLIEKIVRDVTEKLHVRDVVEHPVEMESRVHELTTEWSQKISPKALIIGLWGMGGIGKTTIAKAIYNKVGRGFKARSFLANIRENSKHPNDLVNLQKQLIFDITKTQDFGMPNIDRGKKIIQERFPNIKAFVVLDDVDSVNQLNALCESHEWFCPGSVIIITTRDLHLLNVLDADHKYRMREMNEAESLELFSWYAFRQLDPFENFIELSKNAVIYCGGLPLALEVLGSYLFGRNIEEWVHVLSKPERITNHQILAQLKISFDG